MTYYTMIIELLVKKLFFSKWPLVAILDFCCFLPLTSKNIGNIKILNFTQKSTEPVPIFLR